MEKDSLSFENFLTFSLLVKSVFPFPFSSKGEECLKETITASNFAPKDYCSSMGGYLLFFANKE